MSHSYAFQKEELWKMYSSGLSMKEIANLKMVSQNKIVYWMKKYNLPCRSRSEATYIKHNPHGDPFKLTTVDTLDKRELLALAIGLFLGEGAKNDNYHLKFVNSNPEIIKLFISFLKNICGVDKAKIKAEINLYSDRTYKECLIYWNRVSGIDKKNFYKPVIRQGKKGSYKNKSFYGTITILVGNKKLVEQVRTWCRYYSQRFAEVAQW